MANNDCEVESADAARTFLIEHGLPESKAEIVWDAIALHTSLGIASRKQPEIALVHLGAGMDVFGLRAEDLPPEMVEKVIDTYPRLSLNHALTELLVSQVKRKPEVTAFTWLAEIGRCYIHGFTCPSYQDLIRNSPFSE